MSLHADKRMLIWGTCFIDDLSICIATSTHMIRELTPHIARMFHKYQHGTYPQGCELEVDDAGTYLETFFDASDGIISISHNSRNTIDVMQEGVRDIMRLHHYTSFIPHDIKIGIILGHICRICTNTMHRVDTIIPFLNMLYEYMFLSYPLEVLLVACMRAHCKRPHEGLKWVIDAMHAILHCTSQHHG